MEKIINRIVLMGNELDKIERLLCAANTGKTKKEIYEILHKAIPKIEKEREKLIKYRNVLNPLIAMDESNTIENELQKVLEDIGTVQYMIAHQKYIEADELLQDIKRRI